MAAASASAEAVTTPAAECAAVCAELDVIQDGGRLADAKARLAAAGAPESAVPVDIKINGGSMVGMTAHAGRSRNDYEFKPAGDDPKAQAVKWVEGSKGTDATLPFYSIMHLALRVREEGSVFAKRPQNEAGVFGVEAATGKLHVVFGVVDEHRLGKEGDEESCSNERYKGAYVVVDFADLDDELESRKPVKYAPVDKEAAASCVKEDRLKGPAKRLKAAEKRAKAAGMPGTLVDLESGGSAIFGGGSASLTMKGAHSGNKYALSTVSDWDRPFPIHWPGSIARALANKKGADDGPVGFKVRVVKGDGLAVGDIDGKSDPYVTLLAKKTELCRTPYKKKTLDPVWNWSGAAVCPSPSAAKTITLEVWDHDTFKPDDFLGRATIDLVALAGTGEQTVDLDTQGTVTISVAPLPAEMPWRLGFGLVGAIRKDDDMFGLKIPKDEQALFTVEPEKGLIHVLFGCIEPKFDSERKQCPSDAWAGAVVTARFQPEDEQ